MAKKTIGQLVNEAILSMHLAHRQRGVSLQAIKNHLAEQHGLDSTMSARHIRKHLVSEVHNGTLIQVKGTGASGSFRLPPAAKKQSPSGPAKRSKQPPSTKSMKSTVQKRKTAPKAAATGVTSTAAAKISARAGRKRAAAPASAAIAAHAGDAAVAEGPTAAKRMRRGPLQRR